jgi:hypothetical protein
MTHSTQTAPARKVYRPITTIKELGTHLQWALSVELSTIPPYLCALYSITDTASPAYSLVRSVALEEMLHMMLVSNLMNAIGAKPSLSPEFVPSYPGFIPHHAAGGPFIQLQPLSPALARTVFMPIELPERSPKVPAEGDHFKTIGQFYKAIEQGFETCVERYSEQGVFGRDTGFQRADTYFGSGGGRLFAVHDLHSAKAAIAEITKQGEGSTTPQPPLPGEEPYGGYDHYGPRLDGTYGPILGTPWELSHYRKFQQLADGEVAIPPTYPMQANPSTYDLTGDLRKLSDLFDASYTLVLNALERAFTSAATGVDFFQIAFPVMRFALPPLATLLMQTPLESNADPSLGPTAGPGFAFNDRPLPEIVEEAEYLLAHPPDLGSDYQQLWIQGLAIVCTVLRQALAATA